MAEAVASLEGVLAGRDEDGRLSWCVEGEGWRAEEG